MIALTHTCAWIRAHRSYHESQRFKDTIRKTPTMTRRTDIMESESTTAKITATSNQWPTIKEILWRRAFWIQKQHSDVPRQPARLSFWYTEKMIYPVRNSSQCSLDLFASVGNLKNTPVSLNSHSFWIVKCNKPDQEHIIFVNQSIFSKKWGLPASFIMTKRNERTYPLLTLTGWFEIYLQQAVQMVAVLANAFWFRNDLENIGEYSGSRHSRVCLPDNRRALHLL